MGKEFANEFYGSIAWKNCREAYKKYRRGLCELCLEKGIYTPAEIVHHKIPITAHNVNDPNITLNPLNLLCVCREHHEQLHNPNRQNRYSFDEYGHCIAKKDADPLL